MIPQVVPRVASGTVLGAQHPRLAPPLPVRSRADEFDQTADDLGIHLMPWQKTASMYLTALAHGDRPLYREVAVVVARQNGKSTLLEPLIVDALLRGRRIMHTAQNRRLPIETFEAVVTYLEKRGKIKKLMQAFGRESVTLTNGGDYRIAAPTRGGARGPTNDLVIIDELREMTDWSFIGAAKPTISASPYGQIIYMSNAGTSESVVLNGLRDRRQDDARLAYLEWSAPDEMRDDDMNGWLMSNPAIGHMEQTLETLRSEYQSNKLQGTLAIFETEHLCRWVDTMAVTYVHPQAWLMLHGRLEDPRRPYMAVSMDPAGTRASAVLAWRQTTGHVGVRVVADVTGSPIDVDALGADLKQLAAKLGVVMIGFDPWTDADIARRLTRTKALAGRDYAVACENFARRVSDASVRWDNADSLVSDLAWTTRKSHESGAYHAVRASDEHSITAALAAIRAVWLATSEKPPAPKVL